MTGRVLGGLGLVVVALLGGLWFTLRDDGTAEPAAPAGDDRTARDDRAPGSAAPQATGAPSARSTTIVPRTQPQRAPSVTAPASGGTPPAVEAAAQPEAVEKQILHRSLDEQIGLSEPHLVECVEKATKAGATVDGTTAVSFIIAKKPDGKLGIEATGIEYSSIPDQRTTDCIRDVGNSLTFEELPAGVDRVLAFRKVVVKDGKITENWLTEFAQNPGEQPSDTPK